MCALLQYFQMVAQALGLVHELFDLIVKYGGADCFEWIIYIRLVIFGGRCSGPAVNRTANIRGAVVGGAVVGRAVVLGCLK